jgi:hypothetical protein
VLQYRTILFVADSTRARTSFSLLQTSLRALPHRPLLQSSLRSWRTDRFLIRAHHSNQVFANRMFW